MSDIVSRVWPEWQVETLLGRGSYGTVYRAVRSGHGHTSYAAIKVIEVPQSPAEAEDLVSSGMDEPSVRSYFEQRARGVLGEVAIMEELKGAPNVVSVEDYRLVEREDGAGWSVLMRMPLLEPLKDHFAKVGQPDARETARLGVDICSALATCHARGVIHRDIKPENIFFSPYGYLLGDFGIARRLGPDASSVHTRTGAYPYMAPEVFAGRSYSANVDIYSLGLVLYRYLNNGRVPFLPPEGIFSPADSERAVALRLAGRPLDAPANADTALSAIVLRACDPDPARRFGSVVEMGAALQEWLRAGTPSAAPASSVTDDAGPATVILDPQEDAGSTRRGTNADARRAAQTPNAARGPFGPSGTVRAESPMQDGGANTGQPYIHTGSAGAQWMPQGTGGQQQHVGTPGVAQAPVTTPAWRASTSQPTTAQGSAGNTPADKRSNRRIWAIVAAIVAAMLLLVPLSNRLFGWPRLPGLGGSSPSENNVPAYQKLRSDAVSPGGFLVDDDVCTIRIDDIYFDDDGDLRCDFTITNHTDWVLIIDASGDWAVNGSDVGCIWVGGAAPEETSEGYFLISSGFFSTTDIDDVQSITGQLKVDGSMSFSGEDSMQTFYDVNLTPSSNDGGNAQSGSGDGGSSSQEPTATSGESVGAASYSTDYYSITLPDYLSDAEIQYDKGNLGGELSVGESSVVVMDGKTVFEVRCLSSDWGPQTDSGKADLGSPSTDSSFKVWVLAPNYNSEPFDVMDAQAEEYAQYVEVY